MKRVEYFPKKMAEGSSLGRKSGFRPGLGPPDSSGPIPVPDISGIWS